jgi:VWFA-related protein
VKRVLLLIAVPVAVATLHAQEPPKFKSKVETVRVDALAVAGGKPVTGLSAGDFELRDNGVLQKISLIAIESAPVVVEIALDVSASLTEERLNALREASDALAAKLHPGDTLGFTTFSHIVRARPPVLPDLAKVGDALGIEMLPGQTSLFDAVFASMTLADAAPGRGLLMVFSDGIDTASWLDPSTVLQTARRSETVVYAVRTESRGTGFLHDITNATGGQEFGLEANRLDATFTRILDEFRRRYLLSYEPQGVTRGGWPRIELKSKRRGVSVKARPGYYDR